MTKIDFLEFLSKLVNGELSPKDWILWWKNNESEIEKEITRNDFLKLKPLLSQSEVRATLISQSAATLFLKKEGIILEQSNLYSELWNKEFSAFQKKIREEEKVNRIKFLEKFKILKDGFPKFYKSIVKYLSSDDIVILGNKKNVHALELLIKKRLPYEIQEFVKNISSLKIEGFEFDVNDIQPIKIDSITYIYLGKFNLHSDGDSIILKINDDIIESTIYYLYHSEKPSKIIKIASDFKSFIEKTLVEFMKE